MIINDEKKQIYSDITERIKYRQKNEISLSQAFIKFNTTDLFMITKRRDFTLSENYLSVQQICNDVYYSFNWYGNNPVEFKKRHLPEDYLNKYMSILPEEWNTGINPYFDCKGL